MLQQQEQLLRGRGATAMIGPQARRAVEDADLEFASTRLPRLRQASEGCWEHLLFRPPRWALATPAFGRDTTVPRRTTIPAAGKSPGPRGSPPRSVWSNPGEMMQAPGMSRRGAMLGAACLFAVPLAGTVNPVIGPWMLLTAKVSVPVPPLAVIVWL